MKNKPTRKELTRKNIDAINERLQLEADADKKLLESKR